MKATELMIGDWVTLNRVDYQWQWTHHDFTASEFNTLEPIPLTSEILEKNGWEYRKYKTDYMVKYDLCVGGKNCWMHWAIGKHNLDILRQDEKLDFYNLCVQRAVIPCDYVHELQHALRLCGLDELADNFKV